MNVFMPEEERDCKFHVPLHVPGKRFTQLCTYHPAMDTKTSAHIARHASREVDIVANVLTLMSNDDGRRGKEVGEGISLVDLGSSLGVFTLSAAVSGFKVLALDAMYMNLLLLDTSLRLAEVWSRVTLLHNALSNQRELVAMHVYPRDVGSSSLDQDGESVAGDRGVTTNRTVKAVCLDDLVQHVPTRRVLVKVDIQGSEWLALQCADKFFAKLHVPHVMMEWKVYRHKLPEGEVIIIYMTRYGYRPFHGNDIYQSLTVKLNTTWPDHVLWSKT